ncbi:hypothetical protein FACS1894120_3860 [Clostridia bacterium]|nr:hypothetical protein FACS1894120_3860 [Clostridia bacterium]
MNKVKKIRKSVNLKEAAAYAVALLLFMFIRWINYTPVFIVAVLIAGCVVLVSLRKSREKPPHRIIRALVVFLPAFLFFSLQWTGRNMIGADTNIVLSYVFYPEKPGLSVCLEFALGALLPAAVLAVAGVFLKNILSKVFSGVKLPKFSGGTLAKFANRLIKKLFRADYTAIYKPMAALLAISCFAVTFQKFPDVAFAFAENPEKSVLFDSEYTDGGSVGITWNGRKKNVIHIVAESMETSYADSAYGGVFPKNYIPGLTKLAEENLSVGSLYTDDNLRKLGGAASDMTGANQTVASLFSQMYGVPLIMPSLGVLSESQLRLDLIEGRQLYGLPDALRDAGYNLEFAMGSDKKFARRGDMLEKHGFTVYDYNTAIKDGDIPKDYYVWWGMEDSKLFDVSKRHIARYAESGKPFFYSILTVDTHAQDGYVSDVTPPPDSSMGSPLSHELQYLRVVEGSDKLIYDFVEWVQEQDFYADTVIVITGDHHTMSLNYDALLKSRGESHGDTYSVFINSGFGVEAAGREYEQWDLCPTMLHLAGGDIEGGRMGLGTDLLSPLREKTVTEKYGREYVNTELRKTSGTYNRVVYGAEK